ncbi:MAG TPA: lysylphosphatidylglycerol synthase transmembrane domain-containing protein [Syntrophobacteraceae bacterium]|nr:lysylphosphatidylglycerol synthase transmembrane domain-containing protein [Syntrophobacteraceae bacterium]
MVSIATRKRFWVAAFFGMIVLFLTVKQADLHKFAQHLGGIEPLWAAAVLGSAFLSYACVAGVLDKLLRGIGLSISFVSCFKISMLSCTLNYLMSVAGLSGVAAKVYLLSREEIPPSNTLSVSIIHGFLTNTIAVLFIYLGFFYLYSQHQITERDQQVLGIMVLLVGFLLTWLTVQTIVHERFRKKIWHVVLRVVVFLCERIGRPHWISRERAGIFFENFNQSLNMIMGNRAILLAPASLALLDWIFMFLCLKFSFIAINYPLSNKVLMVGFSIGLFMGLFSLTPASIGVMEGSMAWSFYLMDLDYESCLLAILIYRVAYYYIPIAVSVLFLKRFFPASELARKEQAMVKDEG